MRMTFKFEEQAILQLPNMQFAFLHALMGLQKENRGVKDVPNGLVARKQRRLIKHSQFSFPLFLPLCCYGERNAAFLAGEKTLLKGFARLAAHLLEICKLIFKR